PKGRALRGGCGGGGDSERMTCSVRPRKTSHRLRGSTLVSRVADLSELAAALVAVESINPSLASTASGEHAVAGVVAEWGRRAGLEVELDEALPGRPNVLVTAGGSGSGGTLLLNGHLDTVGVA